MVWRVRYRKNGIILCKDVKFTKRTRFEGRCKVYQHTCIENSEIGFGSYVGWNSVLSNTLIGRYCSVAPFVEVVYGQHPVATNVSTHPAFFSLRKQAGFTFTRKQRYEEFCYANRELQKSVVIGHDVWIGYGAKIMEGVTIGTGAVVAAGSIVTRDVVPYSIVAGIPARHLRFRFQMDVCKRLLEIKWWDKDAAWLENNHLLFDDVNKFINTIDQNTSTSHL